MDPEVWDDVVRATLSSWIGRHFEHCSCIDSAGIPGGRCAKHVEFLWRKRFKDDLVTQFVRSEPWLHKADRLRLRDMMVSCLEVRKSSPPQPAQKHGQMPCVCQGLQQRSAIRDVVDGRPAIGASYCCPFPFARPRSLSLLSPLTPAACVRPLCALLARFNSFRRPTTFATCSRTRRPRRRVSTFPTARRTA